MITLPTSVRNRATFRILTMPEGTWASQTWTALPVPAIINRTDGTILSGTVAQGGYQLRSISRWCLPDEDRASFSIDVGRINGEQVSAQNLSGKVVRIQVQDNESFPTGATELPTDGWKTVFVGSIIYTTNEQQVGAREYGRVTYFCAGTLWRTRNWPLDRHSTATAAHAKGNPGYNVPLHGWFRKVLGNKGDATAPDPFGDLTGPPDISAYYHTHAMPVDGSGSTTSKWTDEEVVKHALASSRATGEPLIEVDLSRGLFTGTFSWPVSAGDVCWDLLRKVCNRQRGRGSVFLDYLDADDEDGDVTLSLVALPSNVREITYNTVSSLGTLTLDVENTIAAAEHGLAVVDVDLVGDHRITDSGFQYDNRESSVFDGVVFQGEHIQALVNLNFFGSSLTKRWSYGFAQSDQTLFGAIPLNQPFQRMSPRWRQVWRRFGIPQGYAFTVKSESASSSAVPINYWTTEFGEIEVGSGDGLSSEMTFRVLPDLPIYEGWNYSASPPVRFDGAADYLPPARMSPLVLYRGDTDASGGSPAWFPFHFAGFNIQTDDFGFYIVHPIEDQTGVRLLADLANAPYAYQSPNITGITTTSGIDLQKINTVLGVELGTRVAIFKNNSADVEPYNDVGRRMTMTINGLHLWLGALGAIWECDPTRAGQNNYAPGLKFPSGTGSQNPYVIRDDRDQLSFIAALGWEYWGQIHNPGTWTLRDCGFLTNFLNAEGDAIAYPALGQIVSKVTYAGTQDAPISATLDTPVTSIHYDHDSGETTWRTDFVSYDGNVQ